MVDIEPAPAGVVEAGNRARACGLYLMSPRRHAMPGQPAPQPPEPTPQTPPPADSPADADRRNIERKVYRDRTQTDRAAEEELSKPKGKA
jgi:hypothetical protein